MQAVIQSGGKQYRVEAGSTIRVEKIDAVAGEKIKLSDVLMAQGKDGAWRVGAPFLTDVVVEATVETQTRDKKVIIFKKQRRQNHRRKRGHRQCRTVLKVQNIQAA